MRQRIKSVLWILLFIIVGVGIGLFLLAPHPPRTPKQVADVAELETYLQTLTESGDPPGLSLAVVKEGELVYSGAFGLADGVKETAVTPDTVYHWWSMTKMATAVAILQLHEQGELNLDDPASDYLPFFDVEYPAPDSPPITIRHLLNHTSGLPDTMPAMIGWVHMEDENHNQTELLKEQLPNFNKLRFAPGNDSAYSNLGYMTLGVIIEAVTDERYESVVVENVLRPLGMMQTDFVYTLEMSQDEAAGSHPLVHFFTPLLPFFVEMETLAQERMGTRYWFNRFYIDATPSTGLIGTAEDAAKLMLVLQDGEPLLSADSIGLMRPNGDKRPLGWAEFGDNWIQHRGGGPGFASIMRLYPDKSLGIVIIANGTNLDSENLVELIAGLDW
ncbi:MAG: beta-lactamase family protein [Chloroflexi bacterium]|nr:beta-lactamase family protein [Chloroflexota bacterium]